MPPLRRIRASPIPGSGIPRGRRSPTENLRTFQELISAQGAIAEDLVSIHPLSVGSLEEAVDRIEALLAEHSVIMEEWTQGQKGRPVGDSGLLRLLRTEHEVFRASVAQLRELLGIVRRDDHGGNRQALGQYWRVFLEAATRHAEDERRLLERPGD